MYICNMQKKIASSIILLLALVILITHCTFKKNNQPGPLAFLPSNLKDSVYLYPGNPFSEAKARLGKYLFYDRRLSVNDTKSCATCHAPEFSFTDNYIRSIGALGALHQRNARPLINLVFKQYLTAADSSIHFPEQQINNPMFNTTPVEMGWKGNEKIILEKLMKDKLYATLFAKAFPGQQQPFTVTNVQYAITSFIKTIISLSSPYDNYINKKIELDSSVIRGMQLFFSKNLQCASCHAGKDFDTPANKDFYANTGLYNNDNAFHYPEADKGLFEITGKKEDIGKFRIPTLRNLAFTGPYLHDGSAASLTDVILIYENGGRVITKGSNKGDGRINTNKNSLIKGFQLNSQQRNDLISFLLSLSDSSILTNPRYANPYIEDETK